MPKRSSTTDPALLATRVFKKLTDAPKKNRAAVALGKLGGAKGGPARAAALSPERRKEISQAAARTRWGKKN